MSCGLKERWFTAYKGIVEYSKPSGTRPYDVSKRACTQPPETSHPDQTSLQFDENPSRDLSWAKDHRAPGG